MPKRNFFDAVLKAAGDLPGIEEGTSYGTRALRVKKKFLCRMKEDGETLAIRIDPGYRDFLMAEDQETFFVTPHYEGYPMILIRLARVTPEDLRDLIERAWRMYAPKRLIDDFEKQRR